MTDNEKKARELLDIALRLGMDISHGLYTIYPKNERPPLTEDECRSIAINYPISFKEVRSIFPWAGMIKEADNFILLAHEDMLHLTRTINDKISKGYNPIGNIWIDKSGELGAKIYYQSMINRQY